MPDEPEPGKEIILPYAPEISGLSFRTIRGSQDYPDLLKVKTASDIHDGDEEILTLEELTHFYDTLTNCDLYRDFLIIEFQGQVIGYSRVRWDKIQDGYINYGHFVVLIPEWHGKGIKEAVCQWNEARLREIAQGHDPDILKYFVSWIAPNAKDWKKIISSNDYEPIRYSFLMVRPDLKNIPDLPLPEGIEVRPAKPEQYRQIWEASREVFSDEWGEPEWQEEWYERWLNEPHSQPELWKIAWCGDEVAGMVQSYISEAENNEFNRKWGYTENIGIRRPYRGKGLAKALIARSLQVVKDQGMEQAALGVDAENPSGALHLYKIMGFQEYQRWTTYRKQL